MHANFWAQKRAVVNRIDINQYPCIPAPFLSEKTEKTNPLLLYNILYVHTHRELSLLYMELEIERALSSL
jgi:hypothetical protein